MEATTIEANITVKSCFDLSYWTCCSSLLGSIFILGHVLLYSKRNVYVPSIHRKTKHFPKPIRWTWRLTLTKRHAHHKTGAEPGNSHLPNANQHSWCWRTPFGLRGTCFDAGAHTRIVQLPSPAQSTSATNSQKHIYTTQSLRDCVTTISSKPNAAWYEKPLRYEWANAQIHRVLTHHACMLSRAQSHSQAWSVVCWAGMVHEIKASSEGPSE